MKALFSDLDDDGILIITIDVKHESMNVFNQQVMAEFTQLAEDLDNNESIKAAVLISGKSDCFVAGADIKMLQQAQTAAAGTAIVAEAHTMLQRIANSKKPFIAAIDGICLGAGYELSLACHYRIATTNPATKIGLPEVMLGLLPGATGTTKLSRLISLPAALDIMLTGKQLDAKRALRLGMIDEVVPQKILLTVAKAAAKKIIAGQYQRRPEALLQKLLKMPFINQLIINKARQQVTKKTRGLYPAPQAILDVVQHGLNKPIADALAYEAKRFGELSVSAEAKQLINIYFATTELKKDPLTTASAKPHNIHKVGILGGGLMGAGIATVCIDKADVSVRMKDIADQGIVSAYQHISQFYQRRVKRKILSLEQAKRNINRLTTSLDYSGFSQCDVIIEAVFEDLILKHQMVADIEALGNEKTLFASNTSSIPITDIASKAQRPENIIGMHYFSPVEKMPLLEVIKHPGTSEQTIATAVSLGRSQGKTVILVNDGAGFYVNRILAPYINAALELGAEGVAFDKIDEALTGFGFPVGPIKLLDEVGIDIGNKTQAILEQAFGERMQCSGIQETLINSQRLGKKTKQGFYNYRTADHSAIDPTIYNALGINSKTEMTKEDIIERCLYRMLNEAALCLEENIINCPRDGDIGAIFGIGFPPFLGGPFRYMDSLGLDKVLNKLERFKKRYGVKYQAAASLLEMNNKKKDFYRKENHQNPIA